MKFFVGDDWLASASSVSRDSATNPARVRSRIKSRSNWASAPNTWKMRRPPGRRGVDRLGQGSQAGAVLFQLVYGLDQMRERTRAAIKLPGDENIAFSHEGEGLRQAGAICLCSRRAILENPVAAGVVKRIELESHVPLQRRNPAHNRSGPSQFSRTRPFCRPTIILSGSPLSSVVSGPKGDRPVKGRLADRVSIAMAVPFRVGGEIPMARRRLFTDEHWASLLAPPTEEREIVRHCTLSRHDLDLIAVKRSDHSRLGFAVLLCYLRHPGRALEAAEEPPAELLAFVADQLEVDRPPRRRLGR